MKNSQEQLKLLTEINGRLEEKTVEVIQRKKGFLKVFYNDKEIGLVKIPFLKFLFFRHPYLFSAYAAFLAFLFYFNAYFALAATVITAVTAYAVNGGKIQETFIFNGIALFGVFIAGIASYFFNKTLIATLTPLAIYFSANEAILYVVKFYFDISGNSEIYILEEEYFENPFKYLLKPLKFYYILKENK